ncbi:DSD1 family PLP-dependent enzyme [Desulfoluna spongiiphila]|uniref:DSD1 family PLP-dependent enzyme n=1 Tax=Desulfoluna spongiiphila TaxID=419481 RepID=UPI00125A1614|nr:DSD1 family PLP-dependent enzyme [Desulfoluna spongiiphila]VVS92632.1 alanine racemase n-terminal [Desulfoluna spongiiphila]
MHLTTLETPCLVLDKAKLQKNIRNLNTRMKALGVNLRPHGKTAKNIDVMTMALEGQEGGITVSTLKEAEYYFEKGITDIVYAVGIAPVKLPRIFRLMEKGADITVLLDSAEQVRFVAEAAAAHGVTVPALIELDCDGHRSGITLEGDDLIAIGTLLHNEHGVSLKGVLTHAGESYQCRSTEAIRAMAEQERSMAVACAEALRASGLPCPVVSVGSTPTSNFAQDLTGVTEMRAGVYMFYDLVMAGLGVCDEGDIAVSVLASVIGHQKRKGWVITDAGWMALSRDRGTSAQALDQGYGRVCGAGGAPLDDLIVSGANQEHGIISDRNGKKIPWASCGIGSMVRILPNHACATSAMYDRYHVVDASGEVVDTWHRVNGW